MTFWIDRAINLCKWPVACVAFSNMLYLIEKDTVLLLKSLQGIHVQFWLGMTLYLVIWRVFFSARTFGAWLPTLVHESIHALFALLTGHRVTNFSVTWRSGGQMSYQGGEGNWLIAIAPYFFPLVTCLALGYEHFLGFDPLKKPFLMGGLFGFETLYVWRQIHPKQTDFQEVSMLFVWMFLPSMLLFTYGCLLNLLLFDVNATLRFIVDMGEHTKTSWSGYGTLLLSLLKS